MPTNVKRDQFVNVAHGNVSMSAANAITFNQILFAVGIFQGVAIVIHRMLYYPAAAACKEVIAATDRMTMALTTSNRLVSLLDISDPAVIDMYDVVPIGTPVADWTLPIVSDMTSLPGGGRIVAPGRLFFGMVTTGAAAASTGRCELQFTFKHLDDKDYIELIQSTMPANI